MSLLPDCRDMSRRISEALDGGRALGPRERLHLWICDVCRRLRAQLALVGRHYERIADHAVTIGERVGFMVTGEHPPRRDESID